MKSRSVLGKAVIAGPLLALLVASSPLSSAAAKPGPQTDSAMVEQAPTPEALPPDVARAGGDADWWSAVQEHIRTSEYHVTWQEQTYLEDVTAAYQAPNRAENLRTYFTREGPIVIPRLWADEGTTPPWRWEVRLTTWGRAGAILPASPALLRVPDNHIPPLLPVGRGRR